MIGKVCQWGRDVARLLGYLFREGVAGEQGRPAYRRTLDRRVGTASTIWNRCALWDNPSVVTDEAVRRRSP